MAGRGACAFPTMKFRFALILRLLALMVSIGLCACDTLKKVTPSLPKLPDLTSVKRLLPGHLDQVDAQDPNIAFDPRAPLQPGHTLRLLVREDLRSARELWSGISVIQQDGTLDLGKGGTPKIGGLTLDRAVTVIGSSFRVAGRTSSPVLVHVISVENQPLLAVAGDLAAGHTVYLPFSDELTPSQAVAYAGGRRAGSTSRALYLATPKDERYYRDLRAADLSAKLQAGAILELAAHL